VSSSGRYLGDDLLVVGTPYRAHGERAGQPAAVERMQTRRRLVRDSVEHDQCDADTRRDPQRVRLAAGSHRAGEQQQPTARDDHQRGRDKQAWGDLGRHRGDQRRSGILAKRRDVFADGDRLRPRSATSPRLSAPSCPGCSRRPVRL
jgi:hypothetical protein